MHAQRMAEGYRVLVVEDEMAIVLLIEEMLLDLGVEVVGPTSHLDGALKLAREASIDAAVLDINIRGGDTYPVAAILEERQIPFLFCTGYSDGVIEDRYRDRPRLAKPYSLSELEDGVLQLLGVRSH